MDRSPCIGGPAEGGRNTGSGGAQGLQLQGLAGSLGEGSEEQLSRASLTASRLKECYIWQNKTEENQ